MQRLQFWRFDNDAIRALMRVSTHLADSELGAPLLDLVYLRVSQLNGCSDCADAHASDAISHGLGQDVVDSVASWRDAPVFTERQRAAFAWAETVTEIPRTGATDEEYRAAATSFSDRELVELTLAIALMNAFARMAIAFRHGPPPTPARAR